MAWQLLNRAYTIGTIDVAQDITPGTAVTGFRDFTLISSSNTTYVVGVQGAKWAYMKVSKVGAILRPSTYIDGSNGIAASVTFDAGAITVFSDLGGSKAVYEDGDGNAQNAASVLRTFSPVDLAALKTTPITASPLKTVALLRGIVADDGKSALYVWDPDDNTTGDDFNYVVSTLSGTGRWVRQRLSNVISRSFATLAGLKAIDSSEWAPGELIELRGITAEGDTRARVVGTWQASSTNTDALDKTFVRPDDITGGNPGRFQFPYDINATAAPKVFEFTGSGGTDFDIAKSFSAEEHALVFYDGLPVDLADYSITVDTPAVGQTRLTFGYTVPSPVKIKIFA